MAVTCTKDGKLYFCLAGDTKPTPPLGSMEAGARLYVTDVPAWFIWTGTAWVSLRDPTPAS